jgi:hypothetical protein
VFPVTARLIRFVVIPGSETGLKITVPSKAEVAVAV